MNKSGFPKENLEEIFLGEIEAWPWIHKRGWDPRGDDDKSVNETFSSVKI